MRWTQEHKNVHTYSQLTEYAFGTTAGVATNVLLTVSQVRHPNTLPLCSQGRCRVQH